MAYKICWEPKGVYKKYAGLVTGEEFLRAVEQVNAHPAFDSFRYVINDFSDCAAVRIDEAFRDSSIAAALGAQRSNPRFVAAFVARDKAILVTLLAIADSARTGMTVRLFQSLEEARRWTDSISA